MFDQMMPPPAVADPRVSMTFRIQEIDNGYVVELFRNPPERPVVNFFPFHKAHNIPLYISQIFLPAAEERNSC